MVSSTGFGGTPTGTLAFLAPTTQVVIGAANQRVHITSSKALGSIGGANGLNLWICTQTGAEPIVQHGGGSLGLSVGASTRVLFTLSFTVEFLPNGTYNVGLCGSSANANWNSNEWGYTSAIVATQ